MNRDSENYEIVRALGRLPAIDSARILNIKDEIAHVEVIYTLNDYSKDGASKQQFEKVIGLAVGSKLTLIFDGPSSPIDNDLCTFKSYSPSRLYSAIGIKRKIDGKTCQFIHVCMVALFAI